MTRFARGFTPSRLAGAQIVMCDTAFPRHLAMLGGPYLHQVVQGVLGTRGCIPPAVRMELKDAKAYAPAVQVLLPPHGLLSEVDLSEEQREQAAALASLMPKKKGHERENSGEAQAIILAQDLGAPLVIDDGDGITAARGRGMQVDLPDISSVRTSCATLKRADVLPRAARHIQGASPFCVLATSPGRYSRPDTLEGELAGMSPSISTAPTCRQAWAHEAMRHRGGRLVNHGRDSRQRR